MTPACLAGHAAFIADLGGHVTWCIGAQLHIHFCARGIMRQVGALVTTAAASTPKRLCAMDNMCCLCPCCQYVIHLVGKQRPDTDNSTQPSAQTKLSNLTASLVAGTHIKWKCIAMRHCNQSNRRGLQCGLMVQQHRLQVAAPRSSGTPKLLPSHRP